MRTEINGNIVDIENRKIAFGTLKIVDGKIASIVYKGGSGNGYPYVLPGFIDAHVHVESSMLVPSEFARLAVVHGTVATISDPHEIANVCGVEGVEYMIANGRQVPFKFYFGAPSCVPATVFETAGASLDAEAIEVLLSKKEINYLSEMMNFPGVLHRDPEVIKKIEAAKKCNKPVDGHAPGLKGPEAKAYIDAGISTDHECFTSEEALDKLRFGMKILIREGSAAKNFDALIDLLNDHEDLIMFCSDDKHPDSLVKGHINELCARAVSKGIEIFKILKAACINPVRHYHMDVGLLNSGDPADLILINDLTNFEVKATYINGLLVAENGLSKINASTAYVINNFNCPKKEVSDFAFQNDGSASIKVIEALDGQLITNSVTSLQKAENNVLQSDPDNDILKLVVVNRYREAPVAKAFVKNFGLKSGAIASSVAHDSHNIIAVGVDDENLCRAVNMIIDCKGGVSCIDINRPGIEGILPLPVAGLMSNDDGYNVAIKYTEIDRMAKLLGSKLSAPYMTLSFMALLVIPHLKLSDLGLFDVDKFTLVS